MSYAKSTHLEQYIPAAHFLSTVNPNKAYLLWQPPYSQHALLW